MTPQEAMEKALEAKQKAEQEIKDAKENKGTFYDDDRVPIKWMGLSKENQRVFRIVGFPESVREKNWDILYFMQSKLLEDNGKYCVTVNWPWENQNGKREPAKDFILTRMYKEIQKGKYDKYDEPKFNTDKGKMEDGHYNHHYKGVPSFIWMKTEFGNTPVNKAQKNFSESFFPKGRVGMNIIDRHDDWCELNNHTKLLSHTINVSEYEDKNGEKQVKEYPAIGISASANLADYSGAYDIIFEAFNSTSQFISEVDCIVKKVDKTITVCTGTDNPQNFESVKDLVSIEPLTEKEENYEKYNSEELFSSKYVYQTILKHLSGRVKQFDIDTGNKFYEELLLLVAKEKEMLKAERGESDDDINEVFPEETKSVTGTKVTEPLPTRGAKVNTDTSDFGVKCSLIFPKWDGIEQIIKEEIVDKILSFDTDVPIFKEGVTLMECDDEKCLFKDGSRTTWPSTVIECPVCGLKYSSQPQST